MSPNSATHWWRRHATELGIDAPLYGLRHLHASTLLQAGVPVTIVSARLGHASANQTLAVYGHFISGNRTVSELLDRAQRNP